jgi:hypothetical protein
MAEKLLIQKSVHFVPLEHIHQGVMDWKVMFARLNKILGICTTTLPNCHLMLLSSIVREMQAEIGKKVILKIIQSQQKTKSFLPWGGWNCTIRNTTTLLVISKSNLDWTSYDEAIFDSSSGYWRQCNVADNNTQVTPT